MVPSGVIKFHKATGQACIYINRKTKYLGKWPNHPESPPQAILEAYAKAVAEAVLQPTDPAQAPSPKNAFPLLLSELAAKWIDWARTRYANPGTPINLWNNIKPLVNLYGQEPAASIGPKRIAEAQQVMAKANGWTRQGILKATAKIRQMFAWGVAQELIDPMHLVKIKAMQPLRHGAIAARESRGIDAVPKDVVEATLPFLSPTVATMVRLQLLTGCRPNEVARMTVADIDRANPRRWVFKPSSHKMTHLGRVRQVPLLPEAIALVEPYLRADGKPLFSPAAEVERWREEKRARRKTKVQPSQVDRSKDNPARVPGDMYDTRAYCRAITRACRKAKVQPWSPNRLRKLAGQMVADALGMDAARSLLGHADAAITREHYAKSELASATRAAEVLTVAK